MWKRFYINPFEISVGVFVIVNGLLTLLPWGSGSSVRESLFLLLGAGGLIVPIFQIVAGCAKIIGIAIGKSNLEAAGLIMVSSLFFIRGIMLVADGDITAADVNNETIAICIIASNYVRFSQIVQGRKYLIAQLGLDEGPRK